MAAEEVWGLSSGLGVWPGRCPPGTWGGTIWQGMAHAASWGPSCSAVWKENPSTCGSSFVGLGGEPSGDACTHQATLDP